MKTIATIALTCMVFASSSLTAFAQGPGNGPDGQQPPVKHPQQQQQQQQHGQGKQPAQMPQQAPRERRQAEHQQRPDVRRGHALPQQYRGEGYQVKDWKKRGLKSPPPGHRWMNVDGNYVLIAVATGVIASVIAHP